MYPGHTWQACTCLRSIGMHANLPGSAHMLDTCCLCSYAHMPYKFHSIIVIMSTDHSSPHIKSTVCPHANRAITEGSHMT